MASKYGWLLLQRPVCFYNIHSNRIIKLPPLGLMNYEHVVKARFTAPPTSPDCVVFVLCQPENYRIKTCNLGDRIIEWTGHTTYVPCAPKSTEVNAICVDGTLYCVFDASSSSETSFMATVGRGGDWSITDNVPAGLFPRVMKNNERIFHLIESDGKYDTLRRVELQHFYLPN